MSTSCWTPAAAVLLCLALLTAAHQTFPAAEWQGYPHPQFSRQTRQAGTKPSPDKYVGVETFCVLSNKKLGLCVEQDRCRRADGQLHGSVSYCQPWEACCDHADVVPAPAAAVPRRGHPEQLESGQQQEQQVRQLEPSCGQVRPRQLLSLGRHRYLREASQEESNCTRVERSNFRPYVVGGRAATVGRWPWIAMVGKRTSRGVQWYCAASLLTQDLIVTAAHCLTGSQDADQLVVRLGEYDTDTTSDGLHLDLNVHHVTVHPGYHPGQKHNDIALLHLAKSVQFTTRIRPVCLPTVGSDTAGRQAELAGWGRLSYLGHVPNVLQQVKLVVTDPEHCEKTFRQLPEFEKVFPGGFRGTKLCARGEMGTSRDACKGDSGGPLVVRGDDGRYQLIGTVSTGVKCADPVFPGIYTRISSYVNWILENAGP